MEVFAVDSLLELRQLRRLFRALPHVIFTGQYVRVQIQVHRIDRAMNALLFRKILVDLAENFNSEVPAQELIGYVADLAESLLVLKRMVDEATSGELYDQRKYEMMGHAAQIARQESAFAGGRFGDLLFTITKTAVICANTGLDLLAGNIWNEHRWTMLIRRLHTVQLDADLLLRSPVLL